MMKNLPQKWKWVYPFFFLNVIFGCQPEETSTTPPIIILKNGDYTQNDQSVPVGDKLRFGITATNGGAILTNLKIQRTANGKTITELDKGIYIPQGGLDFEFSAVKSSSIQEIWRFFVMNSNRDSAFTTLVVNLGEGSAYGEINYFPSVKIGMQNNTDWPHFVNLQSGAVYNSSLNNSYHDSVDIVAFVYTTGGILSPTLCCPGYTGSSSVTGFYPEILNWTFRHLTMYDYYASDNNLVSAAKFDQCSNDSLLVESFNPENISGLCKYCNTGRIVPFKSEKGKYGLIKVLNAEVTDTGTMELAIKIQK